MFKKILKIVGFVALGFVLLIGGVVGFMAIRGDFKKKVIKPSVINFSIDTTDLVFDISHGNPAVGEGPIYSFVIKAEPADVNVTECTISLSNSDLITFWQYKNGSKSKYYSNKFYLNTPIYFQLNDLDDETQEDYHDGILTITVVDKSGLLKDSIDLEIDRRITSISIEDWDTPENNKILVDGLFMYEEGKYDGVTSQTLEAVEGQDYALKIITAPHKSDKPFTGEYEEGDPRNSKKIQEIFFIDKQNQPNLLAHYGEVVKLQTYDNQGAIKEADCDFLKYDVVNKCYVFNSTISDVYEFKLATYPTYAIQQEILGLGLSFTERLSLEGDVSKMLTKSVFIKVSGTEVRNLEFLGDAEIISTKLLKNSEWVINDNTTIDKYDLGLTLSKGAGGKTEILGRYNELRFLENSHFNSAAQYSFRKAIVETEGDNAGKVFRLDEKVQYEESLVSIKLINGSLAKISGIDLKGQGQIVTDVECSFNVKSDGARYYVEMEYIYQNDENKECKTIVTFDLVLDADTTKRHVSLSTMATNPDLNIFADDKLTHLVVNRYDADGNIKTENGTQSYYLNAKLESCVVLNGYKDGSDNTYNFKVLNEGLYLVILGSKGGDYELINDKFVYSIEQNNEKSIITVKPIRDELAVDYKNKIRLYGIVVNSNGSWTYTKDYKEIVVDEDSPTSLNFPTDRVVKPAIIINADTVNYGTGVDVDELVNVTTEEGYTKFVLFASRYTTLTDKPTDWDKGLIVYDKEDSYNKKNSALLVWQANRYCVKNNYEMFDGSFNAKGEFKPYISITIGDEECFLLGDYVAGQFVNKVIQTGFNSLSKLYPVLLRTEYIKDRDRQQTAEEYITDLLQVKYGTFTDGYFDISLFKGTYIYKNPTAYITTVHMNYSKDEKYYNYVDGTGYVEVDNNEELQNNWETKKSTLFTKVDYVKAGDFLTVANKNLAYYTLNGDTDTLTLITEAINFTKDDWKNYYIIISAYVIENVEIESGNIKVTACPYVGLQKLDNSVEFTILMEKYIIAAKSKFECEYVKIYNTQSIKGSSYYDLEKSNQEVLIQNFSGSYVSIGNEYIYDKTEECYEVIAGHKEINLTWSGSTAVDGSVSLIKNQSIRTSFFINHKDNNDILRNIIADMGEVHAIEIDENGKDVGVLGIGVILGDFEINYAIADPTYVEGMRYYKYVEDGPVSEYVWVEDIPECKEQWDDIKAGWTDEKQYSNYSVLAIGVGIQISDAVKLDNNHHIVFEWLYNNNDRIYRFRSDKIKVTTREITGYSIDRGEGLFVAIPDAAGDYGYNSEFTFEKITADNRDSLTGNYKFDTKYTDDIQGMLVIDYVGNEYQYALYAVDTIGRYLCYKDGEQYKAKFEYINNALKLKSEGGWIVPEPFYARQPDFEVIDNDYVRFDEDGIEFAKTTNGEFKPIKLRPNEGFKEISINIKVQPNGKFEHNPVDLDVLASDLQTKQCGIKGIYLYDGENIDGELNVELLDEFEIVRLGEDVTSLYEKKGNQIVKKDDGTLIAEVIWDEANEQWVVKRETYDQIKLKVSFESVVSKYVTEFSFTNPYTTDPSVSNTTNQIYSGTTFIIAKNKVADETVTVEIDGKNFEFNYKTLDCLYALNTLVSGKDIKIEYRIANTENAWVSTNITNNIYWITVPTHTEPTNYEFKFSYGEDRIDSILLTVCPNIKITADTSESIKLDDYQNKIHNFKDADKGLKLKKYKTENVYVKYLSDDLIEENNYTDITYKYATYTSDKFSQTYTTNIVTIDNADDKLTVIDPISKLGTYYVKVDVFKASVKIGEVKFEISTKSSVVNKDKNNVDIIGITAKKGETLSIDKLMEMFNLSRDGDLYYPVNDGYKPEKTYKRVGDNYNLLTSEIDYGDGSNCYYKYELTDIFWIDIANENLDIVYNYADASLTQNANRLKYGANTYEFVGTTFNMEDYTFDIVNNEFNNSAGDKLLTQKIGNNIAYMVQGNHSVIYCKQNAYIFRDIDNTDNLLVLSIENCTDTANSGKTIYTFEVELEEDDFEFETDSSSTLHYAKDIDGGKGYILTDAKWVAGTYYRLKYTTTYLKDLQSLTLTYNSVVNDDDFDKDTKYLSIEFRAELVFNIDIKNKVICNIKNLDDSGIYKVNVNPYIKEPTKTVAISDYEYTLYDSSTGATNTDLFYIEGDTNITKIEFGANENYKIRTIGNKKIIIFNPNGNKYTATIPVTLTYQGEKTYTYNVDIQVLNDTVVNITYPYNVNKQAEATWQEDKYYTITATPIADSASFETAKSANAAYIKDGTRYKLAVSGAIFEPDKYYTLEYTKIVDNASFDTAKTNQNLYVIEDGKHVSVADYATLMTSYETFNASIQEFSEKVDNSFDISDFANYLGVDTVNNWQETARVRYDVALKGDTIRLTGDNLRNIIRYSTETRNIEGVKTPDATDDKIISKIELVAGSSEINKAAQCFDISGNTIKVLSNLNMTGYAIFKVYAADTLAYGYYVLRFVDDSLFDRVIAYNADGRETETTAYTIKSVNATILDAIKSGNSISNVASISSDIIEPDYSNVFLFMVRKDASVVGALNNINVGQYIPNTTSISQHQNIQTLTVSVVVRYLASIVHVCNYEIVLQPNVTVEAGTMIDESNSDTNKYIYVLKEDIDYVYPSDDDDANTKNLKDYFTVTGTYGGDLTGIAFAESLGKSDKLTISGTKTKAKVDGTDAVTLNTTDDIGFTLNKQVSEEMFFYLKLTYEKGFELYLRVVLKPFEFKVADNASFTVGGELISGEFNNKLDLKNIFGDYGGEYEISTNTNIDTTKSDTTNKTETFIPGTDVINTYIDVKLKDVLPNDSRRINITIMPSIKSEYGPTNEGANTVTRATADKMEYGVADTLTEIGSTLKVKMNTGVIEIQNSDKSYTYMTITTGSFKSITFTLTDDNGNILKPEGDEAQPYKMFVDADKTTLKESCTFDTSTLNIADGVDINFIHSAKDVKLRLNISILNSDDKPYAESNYSNYLYITLPKTYTLTSSYRVQGAKFETIANERELILKEDDTNNSIDKHFFGNDGDAKTLTAINGETVNINKSRVAITVGANTYTGYDNIKGLGLLSAYNPNKLEFTLPQAEGDKYSTIINEKMIFNSNNDIPTNTLTMKNSTTEITYEFKVYNSDNDWSKITWNSDLLQIDDDGDKVADKIVMSHAELQYITDLAYLQYLPTDQIEGQNGWIVASNNYILISSESRFNTEKANDNLYTFTGTYEKVTGSATWGTEKYFYLGSGIEGDFEIYTGSTQYASKLQILNYDLDINTTYSIEIKVITINGLSASIILNVSRFNVVYGYEAAGKDYEEVWAGTQVGKLTDEDINEKTRLSTYNMIDNQPDFIDAKNDSNLYVYDITNNKYVLAGDGDIYYGISTVTELEGEAQFETKRDEGKLYTKVDNSYILVGNAESYSSSTTYYILTVSLIGHESGFNSAKSIDKLYIKDDANYIKADTTAIWPTYYKLEAITDTNLDYKGAINGHVSSWEMGKAFDYDSDNTDLAYYNNPRKIIETRNVAQNTAVTLVFDVEDGFNIVGRIYYKIMLKNNIKIGVNPTLDPHSAINVYLGSEIYDDSGNVTTINLLQSEEYVLIETEAEFINARNNDEDVYVVFGDKFVISDDKKWASDKYYTLEHYNNLFVTLEKYSTGNTIANGKALYNGSESTLKTSVVSSYLRFDVDDFSNDRINGKVEALQDGYLKITGNPSGSFTLKVSSVEGNGYGESFIVNLHSYDRTVANYSQNINQNTGSGWQSGTVVPLFKDRGLVNDSTVYAFETYREGYNIDELEKLTIVGEGSGANVSYQVKTFDNGTSLSTIKDSSSWSGVSPIQVHFGSGTPDAANVYTTGTLSFELPSVKTSYNNREYQIVSVRLAINYNGDPQYYFAHYSVFNAEKVTVNEFYSEDNRNKTITYGEKEGTPAELVGAWGEAGIITIMDNQNFGMYSSMIIANDAKGSNYLDYYVTADGKTYEKATAPYSAATIYYKLNDFVENYGNYEVVLDNGVKSYTFELKLNNDDPDNPRVYIDVSEEIDDGSLFTNSGDITVIIKAKSGGAIVVQDVWKMTSTTKIEANDSKPLRDFFLDSEIPSQKYRNVEIIGLTASINKETAKGFLKSDESVESVTLGTPVTITAAKTYNLYEVLYTGTVDGTSAFKVEATYYVLVGHSYVMKFNLNGGDYYINATIDDKLIDDDEDGSIESTETSVEINLQNFVEVWTYSDNKFTKENSLTDYSVDKTGGHDNVSIDSDQKAVISNINKLTTNPYIDVRINANDISRNIQVYFNIVINAKNLDANSDGTIDGIMPYSEMLANAMVDKEQLTSTDIDNNLTLKKHLLELIKFNSKDVLADTVSYYNIEVKYTTGNSYYEIKYVYNNGTSTYTRTLKISTIEIVAKSTDASGVMVGMASLTSAMGVESELTITDNTLKKSLLGLIKFNGKDIDTNDETEVGYYSIEVKYVTGDTYYSISYKYTNGTVSYTKTLKIAKSAS